MARSAKRAVSVTPDGGSSAMKGYDVMNSLAQPSSATRAQPQRNRLVGWSAIASGVALLIVGEKPYFPPSLSLLLLVSTLAFYLGMIPIARWMARGLAAADSGDQSRIIRAAEIAGVAGAVVAAVTAILTLPHWLSAVPAQILDTSSLGVIGLWLVVSTALAFRTRLCNRMLAILGALTGVSWLLAAVIMWVELLAGNLGSLVPTLETLRTLAGYVGSLFYLIWAVWLGIWLLRRKR
jgi:hypothetical protein